MVRKRKLKLRKEALKPLAIVGGILLLIIVVIIFIGGRINKLENLGYSKDASIAIIKKGKYNEVMDLGENKTLNLAFESVDYKDKNFENYSKIKYQKQKDLIKNINALIEKGYKNNEISLIL